MWKVRETHLVDVFTCNQPKDDFCLPTVAVNGTDAEVFCCCGQSASSAPFTSCTDKTHSYCDQECQQIDRKHENSELNEYRGNDFGIFGKEETKEEQFTMLVDQFSPMPQTNDGEKIIREKRNHCSISSSSSNEEEEVMLIESNMTNPLIQSAAVSSIKNSAGEETDVFFAATVTPRTNQHHPSISTEHDDLAYY